MSETLESTAGNVAVSLPAALHAQLQASADKMGLTVPVYLEMLEAVQTGRIPANLVGAIRDIYTHDAEILRELAK